MTLSADLFFSFRSPYSYLALPKTVKMAADYDVTVNLRPVYPLAVRVPGFFKTNPQFARYVVLDSSRERDHDSQPPHAHSRAHLPLERGTRRDVQGRQRGARPAPLRRNHR